MDVTTTRPDAVEGQSTDPAGPFWTTPKVVGVVAAVAVVAVLLALVLSDRFATPAEDSVDVGFIHDMTDHHEQAIRMAVIAIENAGDIEVQRYAREVIIAQQWDIGYMSALLDEWGHGRGDPERDTMVWMDMPTSVANMPGMASPEDFAAFGDSTGREADAWFLRLMTAHHRGGIHLAEEAAITASDKRVRDLASQMEAVNRAELREYAVAAQRLGIELDPS